MAVLPLEAEEKAARRRRFPLVRVVLRRAVSRRAASPRATVCASCHVVAAGAHSWVLGVST
eukprot:6627736-Pyramimonas_sp.AAC.1